MVCLDGFIVYVFVFINKKYLITGNYKWFVGELRKYYLIHRKYVAT